MRQMQLLGGAVPIVRCVGLHEKNLNLSFDGEIYTSGLEWEENFDKIVNRDELVAGALFRELAKYKDAEAVFCFGHAPHLDEVIAAVLGSKRDGTELKKAGVACLELGRVAPPSGTLVWLATPKLLKNFKR